MSTRLHPSSQAQIMQHRFHKVPRDHTPFTSCKQRHIIAQRRWPCWVQTYTGDNPFLPSFTPVLLEEPSRCTGVPVEPSHPLARLNSEQVHQAPASQPWGCHGMVPDALSLHLLRPRCHPEGLGKGKGPAGLDGIEGLWLPAEPRVSCLPQLPCLSEPPRFAASP